MICRHKWWKPGEYFAINPPKYVILCEHCRSTAFYQRHRGVYDIKHLDQEDFEQLFGVYSKLLTEREKMKRGAI